MHINGRYIYIYICIYIYIYVYIYIIRLFICLFFIWQSTSTAMRGAQAWCILWFRKWQGLSLPGPARGGLDWPVLPIVHPLSLLLRLTAFGLICMNGAGLIGAVRLAIISLRQIADSLESAWGSRENDSVRSPSFRPSASVAAPWGFRLFCHLWLCALFPMLWGGWTYLPSPCCRFRIAWQIGRWRLWSGTTSLGSWTLGSCCAGGSGPKTKTDSKADTLCGSAWPWHSSPCCGPNPGWVSTSASCQGSPRTACPTVSHQNLRPVSTALPLELIFLSNGRLERGRHQDCREHGGWPSLCPPEPCGRVEGPWVRRCPGTRDGQFCLDFHWTSSLPKFWGAAWRLLGPCGPIALRDSASSFGGGQWSRGRDRVHAADPPCGFWHWNFAFSERVRPCDRRDGEPAFLGRRCGLSASSVFPFGFCSGMAPSCFEEQFYSAAEEAQPTAKAKSAPTRASPKRPAQRRRTTAALADSPSVPQCLPYPPCLSPSFSVQLVHFLPDHGFAKGSDPVRSPTTSRRRAWVHSIRGSVLGASGPKQTSADGRCFDVA